MRARLVPHTGIAASLRWAATEYGCYGGLRPAPVGSGRLEGTHEGTEAALTKRQWPSGIDTNWCSEGLTVARADPCSADPHGRSRTDEPPALGPERERLQARHVDENLEGRRPRDHAGLSAAVSRFLAVCTTSHRPTECSPGLGDARPLARARLKQSRTGSQSELKTKSSTIPDI
jgi:hypothetical protein